MTVLAAQTIPVTKQQTAVIILLTTPTVLMMASSVQAVNIAMLQLIAHLLVILVGWVKAVMRVLISVI